MKTDGSFEALLISLSPVFGQADVGGPRGHVYHHPPDGRHSVRVVLEVGQHVHDGVANLRRKIFHDTDKNI